MLCCSTPTNNNQEISVYIDGTKLNTDTSPFIENGRTLVPLRAIAEHIGLNVDWDVNSEKITLCSAETGVILYIGNTSAYKNGTQITLEAPPKLFAERTFVPLRFIGECFGFTVGWDEQTRTISLMSEKTDKNVLAVYVLDVGQADCIFVRFPDGKTMLVDGGNRENADYIINFLTSQNVSTLDYLVATHPHSDHIGGLPEIIDKIGAVKIYMPSVSHTTATFEKTLLAVKNSGNKIIVAEKGITITEGKQNGIAFSAKIIAPCADEYSELNNYSAVIMLAFGNRKILLTGDAETVSENQITDNLSADVLKVGHHGSAGSTGQSFLNKVNPDYAIISVGKDNSYGLPSESVLNRLAEKGCHIFRTDVDGTVKAVTDGKIVSVTTYKQFETSTSSEIKVYKTRSGKKYHLADCRTISKSSELTELTVSQAVSQNLSPCSVCLPAA